MLEHSLKKFFMSEETFPPTLYVSQVTVYLR
jgi:hypothetical protein